MDEIQVSVYCLAYNHEKYIRQALEGFVMQKTNFKFEVFVHDDASTDGTAKIIREFEVKYPDIVYPIYQEKNQYSQGIKIFPTFILPRIRGKYIAICEGDDFWCDEYKLQKQFEILENNPDVSACMHKVQCVNEDCSKKEYVIPETQYGLQESRKITSEKFAEILYTTDGYPFHTSSYFLKREVMENSGRHLLYGKMNGDQIILRLAMAIGNIYFIDEIMSWRRLGTVGNWNSRMKKIESNKKIELCIRNIEGEILFDRFLEYRFHKLILANVYQKLYLLLRDYSVRGNTEIISNYKKENKSRICFSKNIIKKKLKYYLYTLKYTLRLITGRRCNRTNEDRQ